jgi:glucose-6-phosphate-specific signal transduction histidine kinase
VIDEAPAPSALRDLPSPPKLDARLDRVLRVFTWLSAALLGAGLAVELAWPGAIVSRVLLNAGIILLLATPGARLVVIAGVHAHRRQWRVVVLAGTALATMAASLVAGLVVLWRG